MSVHIVNKFLFSLGIKGNFCILGVPNLSVGSVYHVKNLLALYLSGTYCHKTSTRPSSCATPRQPTIYVVYFNQEIFRQA